MQTAKLYHSEVLLYFEDIDFILFVFKYLKDSMKINSSNKSVYISYLFNSLMCLLCSLIPILESCVEQNLRLDNSSHFQRKFITSLDDLLAI